MRREGERYPGSATTCARLDCSDGTLRQAFKSSRTLRRWRAKGRCRGGPEPKWPGVLKAMLAMDAAGRPYTSARLIARELDTTHKTIASTIAGSAALVTWRARSGYKPGRPPVWPAIQPKLLEIEARGEEFSSLTAYADRLGGTTHTVAKAIEHSARLRAWRARAYDVSAELQAKTSDGKAPAGQVGVLCPECGSPGAGVIGVSTKAAGIRRRRRCLKCNLRFSTVESLAKKPHFSRGATGRRAAAPPGFPIPGPGPKRARARAEALVQYVTLDQAAATVSRSKRTLERYKAVMPAPKVTGRRGQAAEWDWAELRPWLSETFRRALPERAPGSGLPRRA